MEEAELRRIVREEVDDRLAAKAACAADTTKVVSSGLAARIPGQAAFRSIERPQERGDSPPQ